MMGTEETALTRQTEPKKTDWTKFQVLDGSWLKIIAVVTMLIDHIAAYLMRDPIPLFTLAGHQVTVDSLMRTIGRAAFPIFCFLLTEGFLHTRSRLKYGCNLLIFALISEFPWNLIHGGRLIYPASQSVYVTLFLGFLGLCVLDYFKDRPILQILFLGFLFYCSLFFKADYGFRGFGLILTLYLMREHLIGKCVVGCTLLNSTYRAPIGFLPILLYNGKRGFIRGNVLKYAFYAFYPVHLMILYLLAQRIG